MLSTETETWTSAGIIEDTRRGLLHSPKWLSSLYFYDEYGSRLFEEIAETDEYYPTRTERSILKENAGDILDAAGSDLMIAELGSGSSAKTRVLLRALLDRDGKAYYVPVDVSADFLAKVAADLESAFEGLTVDPIADEYAAGLRRIGESEAPTRLVLFLGSSIGNFEPPEQVDLLRTAHDALAPGDAFLLGTDMVKDPAILEAAYNDADGVTASFNKNILTHLNRELDGDADPAAFDHVAFWNPDASRIEMHLESKKDGVLHFPKADLEVPIAAGERIHTENSHKFTPGAVREVAQKAGWTLERSWSDDKQWFCLHLLRRR